MSRQQCVHRHCSYIPASAVGSKLSGLLYHLSIVRDVHFYMCLIVAGLSEERLIHCMSRYVSFIYHPLTWAMGDYL